MDEKGAKKILDDAFMDIFGKENPLSMEEARHAFAHDIPLPQKFKSAIGDEYTWGQFKKDEKVASSAEILEMKGNTDFMNPKKKISSIDDLLADWGKLDFHVGERYYDSREVAESDAIYSCSNVYRSLMLTGCQNMVYSYNCINSKNLVASRDSDASTSSIRMNQNKYVSSSFDVVWSLKISRSMYIRDSNDLYECIFCSQLASKKYCVANMQFEKDEYFKIKGMVIDWTVKELKKRALKMVD